jgi:hypothetical protein
MPPWLCELLVVHTACPPWWRQGPEGCCWVGLLQDARTADDRKAPQARQRIGPVLPPLMVLGKEHLRLDVEPNLEDGMFVLRSHPNKERSMSGCNLR